MCFQKLFAVTDLCWQLPFLIAPQDQHCCVYMMFYSWSETVRHCFQWWLYLILCFMLSCLLLLPLGWVVTLNGSQLTHLIKYSLIKAATTTAIIIKFLSNKCKSFAQKHTDWQCPYCFQWYWWYVWSISSRVPAEKHTKRTRVSIRICIWRAVEMSLDSLEQEWRGRQRP